MFRMTQALFSLDKQAKYQKIDNPQLNQLLNYTYKVVGSLHILRMRYCQTNHTPLHTYVDGFVAGCIINISVWSKTIYNKIFIHANTPTQMLLRKIQ